MNLNDLLPYGSPTLTPLPVPGWCEVSASPSLSQVQAVLMLPIGVAAPDDWTDSEDIEGVIDNTDTLNSAGKWLIGTGEVGRPEEVTTILGRVKKIITRRKYTLLLKSSLGCEQDYNMLKSLQGNWLGFRFWFYTVGGRFVGGPNGITPSFVTSAFPYEGQKNSTEIGELRIEWDADGDSMRSFVPGIFGNAVESQSAQFQVSVYRQSFPNQIGADLVWTENGGSLMAPYANNVWVFQNGQKLNPGLNQYTITTGSGSATIAINALTHFDGSHYEVYTFEPVS